MHSLAFLIGRTVERVSSEEDGLTLHLDGESGHVSGAFPGAAAPQVHPSYFRRTCRGLSIAVKMRMCLLVEIMDG